MDLLGNVLNQPRLSDMNINFTDGEWVVSRVEVEDENGLPLDMFK